MPHIQQLDPHVADLIAAGEVVERPASVVKELMENAIDAGASKITVEIQNGGMALIRVTDDGCGIAAGEAETAFLRHATSKIRSEYDLEAIGTLGFRGEALAAIAAVSRVDLLTRPAGEELGAALSLEGGAVTAREEAGCPAGTTMVVKDLFFNTPARLKFMKKDAAEGAAVFAAVQRLALSHPEVSVKFLRDGRQELLTPGDGALRSAVYSVLGRDLALGLIPVEGSGEGMSVSGFASLPACCRGTRGYQHFFVNGRYVKSRTMTAALEEAYANQRMVGKFPACVLHLTAKLSTVDVNVHPTKTEVKFGSDKQVFSAVYYAVKSALEGDRSHPAAVMSSPRLAPTRAEDTVTPNQTTLSAPAAERLARAAERPAPTLPLRDFAAPRVSAPSAPVRRGDLRPPGETVPAAAGGRPQAAPTNNSAGTKPAGVAAPHAGRDAAPADVPPPLRRGDLRSPGAAVSGTENGGRPQAAPTDNSAGKEPAAGGRAEVVAPHAGGSAAPVDAPAPVRPVEPVPQPAPPEPEPWRLAGEVLNTYIIVEQGEKVLLIDKHAAHERMHFDRLKAEGYTPMVQTLLTPVVVTLPGEEGAALLQNLELLRRFGFDAEDFGGGSLIVRAAPDHVDAGDIEDTLEQLAGRLLTAGTADPDAARDAMLHTMACKAAIKGGQRNSPDELLRVARAVMDGSVRYCPHGRPVAIELTKGQLEKQFKRA